MGSTSLIVRFAALWLLLILGQSKISWKSGTHDHNCYTQGLSFINHTHVLESCGVYGRSYFQIHRYDGSAISLMTAYKSQIFGNQYFLQGSIYFPQNQVYYILTWRQNTVFRYRYNQPLSEFQQLPQLPWNYDGWGITHNTSHIFISDGSNNIYITDEDLNIKQILPVTRKGTPLYHLNELEWTEENGKQYIYANVYYQNVLAKISVSEQIVVQSWDLSALKDAELTRGALKSDQVFNGIAIHENTIIVTGKRWRSFFAAQYRTSG